MNVRDMKPDTTYRIRFLTRDNEETGYIIGHWTGEVDHWGKLTIETSGVPSYFFWNEITSINPCDREPLTDTHYVAKGGGVCPFCGSDAIDGGPIDVDGPSATQEVTCGSCEETWFDTYALTGYFKVEDNPLTWDEVQRVNREAKEKDSKAK